MKNEANEEDQKPQRLPTQADLDQMLTLQARNWPSFWWNLYINNVQAGFSEQQAFEILKVYIMSQNPNGSRL